MLSLLFLCCCFVYSQALSPCGESCEGNHTDYALDYCWRNFFGTIPCDAVPGGHDESGEETYIGQVYIKQFELLPGTIYRGCPKIRTSAHSQVLTPSQYIKILCSDKPRKLKWKVAKRRELYKLVRCHFVLGGSEVGLTVFIGRVNRGTDVIVGKVFPDSASNAGLWIPESTTVISDFEILTFDC